MCKILMQPGLNNAIFCILKSESDTCKEVIEFVIQPDGSWKRNMILQISTNDVIALEIFP